MGEKRVVFKLEASGDVCVAGDFNNWDATKGTMLKNGGGHCKKTADPSPRVHEYNFLWTKSGLSMFATV